MVYGVATKTMTPSAMTRNRPKTTLGARIRVARIEAGYAINRLARELDVDPRTVNRWQADQAVPSIARLGDIAHVLGKQASYFLETEDAP